MIHVLKVSALSGQSRLWNSNSTVQRCPVRRGTVKPAAFPSFLLCLPSFLPVNPARGSDGRESDDSKVIAAVACDAAAAAPTPPQEGRKEGRKDRRREGDAVDRQERARRRALRCLRVGNVSSCRHSIVVPSGFHFFARRRDTVLCAFVRGKEPRGERIIFRRRTGAGCSSSHTHSLTLLCRFPFTLQCRLRARDKPFVAVMALPPASSPRVRSFIRRRVLVLAFVQKNVIADLQICHIRFIQ